MNPISSPPPRGGARTAVVRAAAALVPLLAAMPALAAPVGLSLDASASLAVPGWVPVPQRPAPATSAAAGPGNVAAESWVAAPNGFPEGSYALGGAGFARMGVTAQGRSGATAFLGSSALARSQATASGQGGASVNGTLHVTVTINPFAAGTPAPISQLGYALLSQSLGCPEAVTGRGSTCPEVLLPVQFQHITQGRLLHSTQGFHQGVAGFREEVAVVAQAAAGGTGAPGGETHFDGEVRMSVVTSAALGRLDGALALTGWTAADFSRLAPHSAGGGGERLYPLGDPRNDGGDPSGNLAGHSLFALRTQSVAGWFRWVTPTPTDPAFLLGLLLPTARFDVEIEQEAWAAFDGGYSWGTVAADFDNTSLFSVQGAFLPDGTAIDPRWLQVSFGLPGDSGPTPGGTVPAPGGLSLAAAAILALAASRRNGRRDCRRASRPGVDSRD